MYQQSEKIIIDRSTVAHIGDIFGGMHVHVVFSLIHVQDTCIRGKNDIINPDIYTCHVYMSGFMKATLPF